MVHTALQSYCTVGVHSGQRGLFGRGRSKRTARQQADGEAARRTARTARTARQDGRQGGGRTARHREDGEADDEAADGPGRRDGEDDEDGEAGGGRQGGGRTARQREDGEVDGEAAGGRRARGIGWTSMWMVRQREDSKAGKQLFWQEKEQGGQAVFLAGEGAKQREAAHGLLQKEERGTRAHDETALISAEGSYVAGMLTE